MVKTTRVFSWILDQYLAKKRFIGLQGGTSSSKTYSILQLLMFIAYKKPNLTISVISESLPHLKKGAIKDFINILKTANLFSEKIYNRSDQSFEIKGPKGVSIVEFFSATSGKVTGPRRDICFFNECNHISKSVHDAAEVRTDKCCFYDFNPTNEFWFHDHVLTQPEKDLAFNVFTYLDNDQLGAGIIRSIESRRERDPEWWKVFGLGQLGTLAGLVFPKFTQCRFDELPTEFKKKGLGMDFGFTNDPTTLMKLMIKGDNLFLHQHLYQTAMHNNDIANFLKSGSDMHGFDMMIQIGEEIVADSAEPKTISDLKRSGFTVIPALKGKDSIMNGIDLIKRYDVVITDCSLEAVKEWRNYKWKMTPDGKPLNIPMDMWNHCVDPTRYDLDFLVNGKRRPGPANFDFGD